VHPPQPESTKLVTSASKVISTKKKNIHSCHPKQNTLPGEILSNPILLIGNNSKKTMLSI
jgi:hypothetical protein